MILTNIVFLKLFHIKNQERKQKIINQNNIKLQTAELRTFELDFLLSPGIQRLNSISSVQKYTGFKVFIVPNLPLTEFHLSSNFCGSGLPVNIKISGLAWNARISRRFKYQKFWPLSKIAFKHSFVVQVEPFVGNFSF